MNKYKSQEEVINSIISILEKEEGYLEKKSNSNLDSKNENAGYNNYTKYWRDLFKLGLMRNYVNDSNFAGGESWHWCAAFITWGFVQSFGIDMTIKLLKHIPFISCQTLADKAGDQLYNSPKIGDLVLFHNGTKFSHTGFIYNIDNNYFYTIEGNTNSNKGVVPNGGSVNKKQYNIKTYQNKNTKFFRPDYSLVLNKANSVITKVKVININSNNLLNCRNMANISGAIIGQFRLNKTLKLIEKTNEDWWKVKGNTITGENVTGYCYSKYLCIKSYVKVNTPYNSLTCFKSQNCDNTAMKGMFKNGRKLELLEKTNSYRWKVKGKSTNNKTITGYCSIKHLEEI